jgi:uncharacterized protein
MRIECHGEELELLPQKGLFWPRTQTLFVADLHLGKAATFRAHGAPVPETATYETLERLTALIAGVQPNRVVILGDLFHAKEATTGAPRDAFLAWTEQHYGVDLKLIVGNHDRKAFSDDDLMDWHDGIDEPPFRFAHHPVRGDRYVLSGHVHPGFRLTARGRRSECLPCFWFAADFAVIPAFGSFTGLALIQPDEADRIYMVTEREVIPVRSP